MGFDAIAGGSPFNVAIGLRRLGVEAGFFAGLSTDYLGRRLRAVLEKETVNTDHLVEFDAPTTLAMVAVGSDGSPTYSFRGDGCADRQLRLEHLPELDAQVRGIHVGSFSLVVQPIADTLLALVARESATRLISLDPNVRLNPAPDIQRWRSQIAAFAEHAHLIKVSDEDLHLLYPDSDPQKSPKAGSASVRNWSSSPAARKVPASLPGSMVLGQCRQNGGHRRYRRGRGYFSGGAADLPQRASARYARRLVDAVTGNPGRDAEFCRRRSRADLHKGRTGSAVSASVGVIQFSTRNKNSGTSATCNA